MRVWDISLTVAGNCTTTPPTVDTIHSGETLAIYPGENAAGASTYYLDMNSNVLEGTKSGSSYQFSGQTITGTGTSADTVSVTVQLDVNGTNVTGREVSTETLGTNMCTATTVLQGVVVNSVDVTYGVN